MPRTKEQNMAIRAEKKQMIMEAALHLFAKKGFAATSINDIAQSAKISQGLLYNYFTSKEEVLRSIWDRLSDEFVQMIDPNQDGEVTPEEAENFIDKTFEMLITRREEMKLYFQFSFQPDVIDIMKHKYDTAKAMERQQFVLKYFTERLPIANATNAYITVLTFVKGLSMALTYNEMLFDVETIEKYKKFIKSIFFK